MTSAISAFAVRSSGASATTVIASESWPSCSVTGSVDLLAHAERQPAADEAPEPGQLDRQRVLADGKRRQEEPAACVGDALEPGTDRSVDDNDARARQHAALLIPDGP